VSGVELRAALEALGLSQAEFAGLLGVTPRAVALWLAGERLVPGPVVAYLRIVKKLSPARRIDEFLRVMRPAMWRISRGANAP
jgi:DNA-binding transcriptional regulator YiaG